MQLKGARVLITGAGSGIGRALARDAVRRGMVVALCGRRSEALKRTAALAQSGTPPLIIASDVTLADDRRRIVARLTEAWGGLEVLVNNAGVVEGGQLQTMLDAALERIVQTNFVAPMALTRDLLALLSASGAARIVNIGSVFGDIPYPGFAAYSASKFALRGFSDAIRRELAGSNIGVTYVAPRATQTDAAGAFEDLIAATKMRLDLPERVARDVWRAIAKNKDCVYPPGPERIFVLIERLFPRLISWGLPRQQPSAIQLISERQTLRSEG